MVLEFSPSLPSRARLVQVGNRPASSSSGSPGARFRSPLASTEFEILGGAATRSPPPPPIKGAVSEPIRYNNEFYERRVLAMVDCLLPARATPGPGQRTAENLHSIAYRKIAILGRINELAMESCAFF